MTRSVATLLAVAAVLVAVPAAPAAAPVPLATYAKRADAICASAAKRTKAVPQPTSAAGIRPYFQRTLRILGPATARLRALPLPTTRAATARRQRTILARELALVRKLVRDLAHTKRPTVLVDRADGPLTRLGKQEDAGWRTLGADVCRKD